MDLKTLDTYQKPCKRDLEFGVSNSLSQLEVKIIRGMIENGDPVDVVCEDMAIDGPTLDMVVNGGIWPYAGGRLVPLPRNGLKLGKSVDNSDKFVRGVYMIAQETMTPGDFEVLCAFNGYQLPKVESAVYWARLAKRQRGDSEDGKVSKFAAERIRRVLRHHARPHSFADALRLSKDGR